MLDTDDVRLLADIGFMIASRGETVHASRIFEAVVAARPDQDAGHLGRATLALLADRPADALAALKGRPPSPDVLTFRALALMRLGAVGEAEAIVSDLKALTGDHPAAKLADACLSEPGRGASRPAA